jgi:uncharacterized membrane protein YcaP (DUF421 family)
MWKLSLPWWEFIERAVMQNERLTQDELHAAVRLAGCASIHDVHFAILENNGQISVRTRH